MDTDGFIQSFDMIENTASKSPTLEPLFVLWIVAVPDVASVVDATIAVSVICKILILVNQSSFCWYY